MPGYDKTGPMGKGAGTGGGRGFCDPAVGSEVKDAPEKVYGAGRGGRPFGGGRGRVLGGGRGRQKEDADDRAQNGYYGMEPEKMSDLKNRAAAIERELGRLREQISRTEGEK